MKRHIAVYVGVGLAVVFGMIAARRGFSFQEQLGIADALVLLGLIILTGVLVLIARHKRTRSASGQ